MRWPALVAALFATLLATGARAGADLVLLEGGVLSGVSVERTRDGLYLLTTDDGAVLAIPVSLVKSLRLTGGEDPAPTGWLVTEPRVVAGPPDHLPRTSPEKLLAAFGRPPAPFAKGAINPTYRMTSALGPDVSDFNPVRWYQSAQTFEWTPTPAFRASQDVTAFNPVRWYRSPTDPTWRPASGWR